MTAHKSFFTPITEAQYQAWHEAVLNVIDSFEDYVSYRVEEMSDPKGQFPDSEWGLTDEFDDSIVSAFSFARTRSHEYSEGSGSVRLRVIEEYTNFVFSVYDIQPNKVTETLLPEPRPASFSNDYTGYIPPDLREFNIESYVGGRWAYTGVSVTGGEALKNIFLQHYRVPVRVTHDGKVWAAQTAAEKEEGSRYIKEGSHKKTVFKVPRPIADTELGYRQ